MTADTGGHRLRVISTMTGAGYLWQAWCETEGCLWRGASRRGALGGRQLAESDAASHQMETTTTPEPPE